MAKQPKKPVSKDVSESIGTQLKPLESAGLPSILPESFLTVAENDAQMDAALEQSISHFEHIDISTTAGKQQKLQYAQSALRGYSAVGKFEAKLSVLCGAIFESIVDDELWRYVDKLGNPLDPSKGEKTDWKNGWEMIKTMYPHLSDQRIKQIKQSFSDARYLRKFIAENDLPPAVNETDVRHSLAAEERVIKWLENDVAAGTVKPLYRQENPDGTPTMISVGKPSTVQDTINNRIFARNVAGEVYTRAVETHKTANGHKEGFKPKPSHNWFLQTKLDVLRELGVPMPKRKASETTVEGEAKRVDERPALTLPEKTVDQSLEDLIRLCRGLLNQYEIGKVERASLPDSEPLKVSYWDMMLTEDDRAKWQKARQNANVKTFGPSFDTIDNAASAIELAAKNLLTAMDHYGPAVLVFQAGKPIRRPRKLVAQQQSETQPQPSTETSTEPQ